MKKQILIALLGLTVISITACSQNPYSGTYACKGNDNLILKLNSNNTCNLINTFYKNSEIVKGNYKINNNNIEINFAEKSGLDFYDKVMKGTVEGENIEIKNLNIEFRKE